MSSSFRFDAIGTQWAIDISSTLKEEELQRVERAVLDRIEKYDQVYSRFRADSLITKMSRQAGQYLLPEDSGELFALYEKLYKLTNGKFTPLIGRVMEDAGYDAAYSFREKQVIRAPQHWEDVIEYSGGQLIIKQPALLDLGAAGKGHLIDIIGQLLEEHQITTYTVDGSGDLLHKSSSTVPLRIGLEHPADPTQVIGVAKLQSGSLCASATQRRAWGRFHHIIDPVTLLPAERAVATWVVADTALVADGVATYLFLEDPQVLSKELEFEYALLHRDYTFESSASFPGEFFR